MAKRRRRGGKGSGGHGFYTLTIQNPEFLKAADSRAEEFRAYHVAYHAALESQQAEHREAIRQSLLGECRPVAFSRWQRRVSSKYSLTPLSSRGSALHAIGGRFNVGRIDPDRLPPFPALYLAEDQDTALQEALGGLEPNRGMSFRELALKGTESFAMYALSGSIETVLDITDPASLKPLVETFGHFRIPEFIAEEAKRIKENPPHVVRSVKQLMLRVMDRNWRRAASLVGVAVQSQQLGRMARAAGIEAIRYRSVKSRQLCLAVFPENFAGSDSYIELDDPTPPEYPDLIRRLDRHTWPKLI
jgi:hypothetical protein